LRGVEKLAEELIAEYEMPNTYQSGAYYKIIPSQVNISGLGWDLHRPKEKPIMPFKYTSDSKDVARLTVDELKSMVGVG
jgi:FlaA1/EpsC-like NDP-sugar epimerase